MDDKLLGIYLNDHLAGHVAGIELAKRAASSNKDTALGQFLEGLVTELESERQVMERVLEDLDRTPSRVKLSAAWIAEKAGRLKLNGQIVGYSPLSRIIELEAMSAGAFSKLALWKTLERVHGARPSEFSFSQLTQQAERQIEELETHRIGALAAA